MIPIQIDISDIILTYRQVSEDPQGLSTYILDKLTDSYMFEWEALIDSRLHRTRSEYRKAVYVDRIDSNNVVIGLSPTQSRLALMIENGASPFDIKEGMSKSPKRHIKKDGGWYITIPFRWATSEAIAESAVFSNKMPLLIQNAVKELGRGESLQSPNIPNPYDRILQNKTTGYQHKASIYEGLHRKEASSTKNENRGNYYTFRRISDKSDPDSWIHSGFVAHNLMDEALMNTKVDMLVGMATDEFLGLI